MRVNAVRCTGIVTVVLVGSTVTFSSSTGVGVSVTAFSSERSGVTVGVLVDVLVDVFATVFLAAELFLGALGALGSGFEAVKISGPDSSAFANKC